MFLHADSEDWSDWADAQADPSLRWAHSHFVGFVMSRLNYLQLKLSTVKSMNKTEIFWSHFLIYFDFEL